MRRRQAEPAEDRLPAAQREFLAEVVPIAPGSAEKAARFVAMRCQWCGGVHNQACPRVARMEVDNGGRVTAVEFWAWGTWPEDRVIYPDDIWPADE